MKNVNCSFICIILCVIFLTACGPFRSKEDLEKKNGVNKKKVVSLDDVVTEKKVEVRKPIKSINSSNVSQQVKNIKSPSVIVRTGNNKSLPLVDNDIDISDKDTSSPIDEDVKLNASQNNELVNFLLDNINKQKGKLKNAIDLFNKTYAEKKGEFEMLKLPLYKIKKLINSAATQSSIYEILGYSHTAIGQFKFILDLLDLENSFSRDVRIIHNFISHLIEVSSLTHKVLYEDCNLNALDLDQIVINNGKEGIDSLCRYIEQFMQLRDQFIIKAQNAIGSAYNNNAHLQRANKYKTYKTYKDVVLDILENELISPNGTLVRALEDLKEIAEEINLCLKI